jgi:ABC-2 type transport system permease protein/lipopolysaccharide transport system permease protein
LKNHPASVSNQLSADKTMINSRIASYWSELHESRHVLYQLVKQHLILRYRRTFLGYLWTLLNPLLMMSVTAIVFSTLFQVDLKTYAIFLFAGMIPFSYFSSSVTQNGLSLIGNEGLIKKIYIPKLVFPLSTSLGLLLDSVLTSAVLFLIILAIGGKLSLALLFIPLAYLLLFLFSLSLSMVMAVSTVYFRDLQYVTGILMQALFFLTPIMYKPEALAGKVAWLVSLNPLVPFIELFRGPIYLGTMPSANAISRSLVIALISLVVGFWFFMRHERRLVFRL